MRANNLLKVPHFKRPSAESMHTCFGKLLNNDPNGSAAQAVTNAFVQLVDEELSKSDDRIDDETGEVALD